MARVSIFQTIQTKYVGPTNFRGSRIKARTASSISIMRSYDSALDSAANHAVVADELQTKMKWQGEYWGEIIGGQNADGSYTWIMAGTTQTVEVAR